MSKDIPPTREAILDAFRKNGGHLTLRAGKGKETVALLGLFMSLAEEGILERLPNDHLAEFTFRLKDQ